MVRVRVGVRMTAPSTARGAASAWLTDFTHSLSAAAGPSSAATKTAPADQQGGGVRGRRGHRRRLLVAAPVEPDSSAVDPPPEGPIRAVWPAHLTRRTNRRSAAPHMKKFTGRPGGRSAQKLAGPAAEANAQCGAGVRCTVRTPVRLRLSSLTYNAF